MERFLLTSSEIHNHKKKFKIIKTLIEKENLIMSLLFIIQIF